MGEANEAIASGRKVYLVVKELKEGGIIDEQVIDEKQRKDLNRGRKYLIEVASRYKVKVYDEIEPCIMDICKDYGKK